MPNIPDGRDQRRYTHEGRKALSQYKAALRVFDALSKFDVLSTVQQNRLEQAKEKIESGRAHFIQKKNYAADDTKFHNKVQQCVLEMVEKKRQMLSDDLSGTSGQPIKRPKPEAKTVTQAASTSMSTQPSELDGKVVKKDGLTVALIDKNDDWGKMSLESWNTVEIKQLPALISCLSEDATQSLPSFDGTGWLFRVKIIKCNDQRSLEWCTKTVKELPGLQEGADLEIVAKRDIPSGSQAKVFIPTDTDVMSPETALQLLQRQNTDIPTSDWKLFKTVKPENEGKGQILIIQINKQSENLLYSKQGKMALGIDSVHLQLKKRNAKTSMRQRPERWTENQLIQSAIATCRCRQLRKLRNSKYFQFRMA